MFVLRPKKPQPKHKNVFISVKNKGQKKNFPWKIVTEKTCSLFFQLKNRYQWRNTDQLSPNECTSKFPGLSSEHEMKKNWEENSILDKKKHLAVQLLVPVKRFWQEEF